MHLHIVQLKMPHNRQVSENFPDGKFFEESLKFTMHLHTVKAKNAAQPASAVLRQDLECIIPFV